MSSITSLARARQHLAVGASLFALIANLGTPAIAQEPEKQPAPTSPIKHVIVLIGEKPQLRSRICHLQA